MTKNSYLMIHQLNLDGSWGKYEDCKDQMINLDNFMKKFEKIYIQETRISPEKIQEILKRDLFMDSQMCIDFSIVDEIWE